MNKTLRDILERMRKFSEYLLSILKGKNKKNWQDIVSVMQLN